MCSCGSRPFGSQTFDSTLAYVCHLHGWWSQTTPCPTCNTGVFSFPVRWPAAAEPTVELTPPRLVLVEVDRLERLEALVAELIGILRDGD